MLKKKSNYNIQLSIQKMLKQSSDDRIVNLYLSIYIYRETDRQTETDTETDKGRDLNLSSQKYQKASKTGLNPSKTSEKPGPVAHTTGPS
jgi:hypothetical protein